MDVNVYRTKRVSMVMHELVVPLQATPELYCDNLSSVHLIGNPDYLKCFKHFELDYYYVCERLSLGALVVTCERYSGSFSIG